jgi:GNAT superfamily N-acetyltransferase
MGVVVDGLDAAWLDRAASAAPLTHAYAVWDRIHEKDRTRFVSYLEHGETRAYLLIWVASTKVPMVHYVGPPDCPALLDRLPPRPMLAVVPPELVGGVRLLRGPVELYEVELRSLSDRAPAPRESPGARRLNSADAAAVAELARGGSSPMMEGYRGIDLERVPTFGAFEGDRLVGIARAAVTLRSVWLLTGIVVLPEARGRGHGRAVTSLATRAAVAAGARPALYVRADNLPAVRLYEQLGFERVARKAWVDAGAHRPP